VLIGLSNKLDSANKNEIKFEDFKLKNYKLIIVSGETLTSIFKDKVEQGWEDFYRKYPKAGGIVRMSRLFLEKDKTKGLIYISISKGGLNGVGYLVYFDLSGNRIIKKQKLWIS
jgi:hypothetical protein